MRIEQSTCSRCKAEDVLCVLMPDFGTMMFHPICGECDPDLFARASEIQKESWLKGEGTESSDM